MTWLRQVFHVVGNDARGLWPFIALHLLVLAYGVLEARGDVKVVYALGIGPLLPYGTAMLVAALLMHRHSPAEPAAHWSGLPFERSAIWAAKWIMLGTLVTAGLVAIVLAIRDLPLPDSRASLLVTIKVASLCGAVAAAALLGTLERELRTVLMLLIALPLASLIVLTLAAIFGWPETLANLRSDGLKYPSLLLLGTALAALFSRRLYRRHSISERARKFVLLGCVALFMGAMTVSRPYIESSGSSTSSWGFATAKLTNVQVFTKLDETTNVSSQNSARQTLIVRMEGAPTTLRAQWRSISERRIPRSATSYSSEVLSEVVKDLYTPLLPIAPTPRWLTASASESIPRSTDEMEWKLQSLVRDEDGTDLVVNSGVSFSRPVMIARLPVRTGARGRAGARQFRIVKRGGSELACEQVHLSEVCGAAFPDGSLIRLQLHAYKAELHNLSFALVNAERREAIEAHAHMRTLRGEFSSQMLGATDVAFVDWLLVPGADSIPKERTAPLPVDEEWLRGAELLVFQWVLAGHAKPTLDTASAVGIESESRASAQSSGMLP